MLLSMTGFGEAHFQSDTLNVGIELRALNNRYLKVSLRAPEPYQLLEAEFEKVIRRSVKRGTLQVQLRLQKQASAQDFKVNSVALRSYLVQVRAVSEELRLGSAGERLLAGVLALPGVVPEPGELPTRLEDDWTTIEPVLMRALDRLNAMRQEEGRAMAAELLALRDHIGRQLEAIRGRAPAIVEAFRDRLLERVKALLGELDVQIDRSDLIKEVSVFAERSDIGEEVVRLASHLDQFQEIINESESAGRKLEFLTQEMFREANTIGSKASDVEISRHVVEIKSALEKIRELVQNIE